MVNDCVIGVIGIAGEKTGSTMCIATAAAFTEAQ